MWRSYTSVVLGGGANFNDWGFNPPPRQPPPLSSRLGPTRHYTTSPRPYRLRNDGRGTTDKKVQSTKTSLAEAAYRCHNDASVVIACAASVL